MPKNFTRGFYDFTKPEDIKAYVKEFNELRDDFHKSQQAVVRAINKIHNMDSLRVEDRNRILDLISEAEI